jgi:hypothetical protein
VLIITAKDPSRTCRAVFRVCGYGRLHGETVTRNEMILRINALLKRAKIVNE